MIPPGLVLDGALNEVADRLHRSTVVVDDCGAGVVWRPDGLIITNAHVVKSQTPLVRLHDGDTLKARVVGFDRRRDLAALKVKASDLPAAAVADSRTLKPGHIVFAVGHPRGRVRAVTAGVVHQNDRRWIRADVHLEPGNSGGPLADARGAVVGINSMIAFHGAHRGLALAVPSHAVGRMLRGNKDRPRLGVTLQAVALDGPAPLALRIHDVFAGGAADKAGLQSGDLVVGADEHVFHSVDDLADALQDAEGSLHLLILRDGVGQRCDVPLR